MTKKHHVLSIALAATLSTILASCSDGSSTADASGSVPSFGCDGSCSLNASNLNDVRLTVTDVQTIIAQGVFEAQTRQFDATIAVVDRVGNVLGVYRMGDRRNRYTVIATELTDTDNIIDAGRDQSFAINAGLEGIKLPNPVENPATGELGGLLQDANLDHLAAVSKAITGAYLSTEGMAFTSRTANQIVQDHFNPGEDFQPGGPLFGVQFSQLACGDFTTALSPAQLQSNQTSPGPHASPLGLSADAGGFPLYKNGTLVGGVGVMADAIYGVDKSISDVDANLDELIALAATFGYGAPIDRRDQVTVDGKVFRYSDADYDNLLSSPPDAPNFNTFATNNNVGSLVAVRNFSSGTIKAGTAFGQPQSGIRADTEGFFPNLDAFVFVDQNNNPRFPPRGGFETTAFLGAAPLSELEVRSLLSNALAVANDARAQIRLPLGSPARVTISVVDSQGNNLGMVRGRDAPVFGADVSLQKARTAAFFSSPDAGNFLRSSALPEYNYLRLESVPGEINVATGSIGSYVNQLSQFLNTNSVLDGSVAFSDRAGGNLSRPFYPDGINNTNAGPLSKPQGEWSVFSTGLQLDLSINAILTAVVSSAFNSNDGIGVTPTDPPGVAALLEAGVPDTGCVGKSLALPGFPVIPEFEETRTIPGGAQIPAPRLANGLQIFPGSVPVYRGDTLVGAIGVSGDGVDQDDMISFLGVHRAGIQLNTINNAPKAIRADNLTPQDVRLRYVQCPQAPFNGSSAENVCEGL